MAAILLVDDDPDVRETLADMLRDRGHEVTEATEGLHALELLAAGSRAPDLLVTDIRMPRLDGFSLARLAVARIPKLRVLYVTGYFDPQQTPAPGRGAKVLTKPVDYHGFHREVELMLGAAC
jgi:CheY-like chemotaxis protein